MLAVISQISGQDLYDISVFDSIKLHRDPKRHVVNHTSSYIVGKFVDGFSPRLYHYLTVQYIF